MKSFVKYSTTCDTSITKIRLFVLINEKIYGVQRIQKLHKMLNSYKNFEKRITKKHTLQDNCEIKERTPVRHKCQPLLFNRL